MLISAAYEPVPIFKIAFALTCNVFALRSNRISLPDVAPKKVVSPPSATENTSVVSSYKFYISPVPV